MAGGCCGCGGGGGGDGGGTCGVAVAWRCGGGGYCGVAVSGRCGGVGAVWRCRGGVAVAGTVAWRGGGGDDGCLFDRPVGVGSIARSVLVRSPRPAPTTPTLEVQPIARRECNRSPRQHPPDSSDRTIGVQPIELTD